ncbi:multicopper oxidase family protein [Paenibacillus piri]|uniref:Multicopper oxidase family protein n=2 Tax=Paenibacillus piri TaxID=2547395 RepID=A0A4R5KP36_9BACL|nr:multicopper oxidase family protein [Paenibacillus piri]
MESELIGLLLLVIFAWIAGSKASRLVYSPNTERLHRKARKQLFWAGYILVPAAAVLTAIVLMILSLNSAFWQDRAFLHAPLVAIPVLSVFVMAVPKLVRLRKGTKAASEAEVPLEADVRGHSAEPGLIVPFQATALGALTAFYYSMSAPVPFQWDDTVPLVLFLVAVAGLWVRHDRRYWKVSHPNTVVRYRPWVMLLRNLSVLIIVVLAAGGVFYVSMQNSRLPEQMDMMSGVVDYGGGAVAAANDHAHHSSGNTSSSSANSNPAVSVSQLTGPRTGTPDRKFTLTAEKATVRLSSGKSVDAWTYNGQIPGPELRIKQGELIEVTLNNKDIEQGATIHWHGLDVPNAEDGVAGVTQDSVMPGETYTYRFVAEQAGTFWYHSHQQSKEAVQKGLFGALIVEPKTDDMDPKVKDITLMTHRWNETFAVSVSDSVERMSIEPGTPVRLRLVNTDDWVRQKYQLTGTPFQVSAIDGSDLHQPEVIENTLLELTTGGRYDITFVMPDTPVFMGIGGKNKLGLFMSPDGKGDIPDNSTVAATTFNPAAYGSTGPVPFHAASRFDRNFTMILDNKLGFYNGQFNNLYTINGEVFPDTPMFMVREGELVKTTIINRGAVDHPMHLHGHHMLVLSRNGKPVTGTWWSDTLDVLPGDTYEVAFRADNPGIWMDHCHNLVHAAAGMTMHLMYEGVTSPFTIGSATRNHPE